MAALRLPNPFKLWNRADRRASNTHVRMLEGASGKRWHRTPPFGPLASEIMGAGQIRGRTRHLRHNDPTAANAAAIYKTGLVGAGIMAASQHPDDETRAILDAAFSRWDEATNFSELQAEIIDAIVTDGESVLVMRMDDDGQLRLQHIPAELLADDLTMNLGENAYIVGGVEFRDDAPVAYHIRRSRVADIFPTAHQPDRIEADDVIHVFRRQGAGQHRGLSWFAPVVLPLNELGQLQDALLVTAKTQALLTGFLVDLNGTAANPFGDGQQSGDIMNVSLEPGTMRVLPSGFDVKFSNPAQMQQSMEYAGHSLRLIAAGLQIPEFLLSGNMGNVNYSSARTALIQFRSHLEQIQFSTLVPRLFNPIWRRWLTLAVLSGEIDLPDFESGKEEYFSVEWHFPAQPWIDPKKDADGTAQMIASGLMSRRQAVAALGYSVEKLDREIAADRARESTLGLQFGAPAPQPSKKDDENV